MRLRSPVFTVAVDFDGTLTRRLPGDKWELDPVAVASVFTLYANDVSMFLYTARVGDDLRRAIRTVRSNQLPITTEFARVVKPNADFYIDDKAVIGGVIDWKATVAWILKLKEEYVHNS